MEGGFLIVGTVRSVSLFIYQPPNQPQDFFIFSWNLGGKLDVKLHEFCLPS